VIVMGVAEPGAATREPRQATVELRTEAIQIIAPQLVDRDQDNE
jgi:hypothetical protein